MDLYVGTDDGLAVFEGQEEEWRPSYLRLKGHRITAVAVAERHVWAGTTDGLWRSLDGGITWSPVGASLNVRHLRALATHPIQPQTVLAGTEPATVFFSRDGGRTWAEALDVARLRDEHGWSLPYSPAAGCIRGFALQKSAARGQGGGERGDGQLKSGDSDRIYAAAEVGGVLRSDDAGTTWELLGGGVHPDVHDLAQHPSDPDLVYAATGGGCYRSRDGGRGWELIGDGYTRAVCVDPDYPETVLVGPARYVGAMGRIERSTDSGDTWSLASDGFKVPMSDMIERFVNAGSHVLALTSDGALYTAKRGLWMWHALDFGLPPIRAVTIEGM